MTRTVADRGHKWSSVYVTESFLSNDTTQAQAEALMWLAVERFHKLAEEKGSTAAWFPTTSEVTVEVVGEGKDMWSELDTSGKMREFPDGFLEELRDQATQEVWDAGCGDEASPVFKEVEEIFASEDEETAESEG